MFKDKLEFISRSHWPSESQGDDSKEEGNGDMISIPSFYKKHVLEERKKLCLEKGVLEMGVAAGVKIMIGGGN